MRIQLERALLLTLLCAIALMGAMPSQRSSPEQRITALETALAGIEQTQETTLRRLDQIRLDVDNTLEPLRVRLADYGEDMRGIESRMVALEEQLAMMNQQLAAIADGVGSAAPATSSQSRGVAMPPPQPPSGVTGPSVARPAAGAREQPEAPRSEADALYSAAYTDYLAANYPLAISGFEEYLRLFPESERADNAQYWIGESHFWRQQFQVARTSFLEIPRRFPNAETVPDALFKAARCLVEMGDGAQAIDELIDLVRERSTSDTVPIACLQIERLGGIPPAECGDR